jgi:hypothetical protein
LRAAPHVAALSLRARPAESGEPFRITIAPQRPDCVAGVGGLELRNVDANYLFERSHRFAGIQPNSGFGDYSRLSCGVGMRSSGVGQDLGSDACAGDTSRARADFPDRAEFRPWRPLAFELQRWRYAARGWVVPGIFSKHSARTLAIMRRRREGTNWPRSLLSIRR